MQIDCQHDEVDWDSHDPLWAQLEQDWSGQCIGAPASFALLADPQNLWFFARREKRASISPDARPHEFFEGLWNHDVAELFIKDAVSERYLEINLAPNGAWWSAEFNGPRMRARSEASVIEGVQSHSRTCVDGSWQAALAIPISYLELHFGFGMDSRLNVTFIVDSPEQRFLSAVRLPGDTPDFHQPGYFERVVFTS